MKAPRIPFWHWSRMVGAWRRRKEPQWENVALLHLITGRHYGPKKVLIHHYVTLRESNKGQRRYALSTPDPHTCKDHPVFHEVVVPWCQKKLSNAWVQEIEANFNSVDERYGLTWAKLKADGLTLP
jgi:hypothetical protein